MDPITFAVLVVMGGIAITIRIAFVVVAAREMLADRRRRAGVAPRILRIR